MPLDPGLDPTTTGLFIAYSLGPYSLVYITLLLSVQPIAGTFVTYY